MKFIHRVKGAEGRKFSFSIEINSNQNDQLSCPLILKIIKQNFLGPEELEMYDYYFSSFAHPLTNSFHYKSSRNSFFNFYSHLLSILFPWVNDPAERASADEFARETKKLQNFLKNFQTHFLENLDQELLKKVRSFTHDRWAVYCLIKKYHHPYLLQLIDTTPALISMLAVATIHPTFNSPFVSQDQLDFYMEAINFGAKPKFILESIFYDLYNHPKNSLWEEFQINAEDRMIKARTDWVWLCQHAPANCGGLTLLTPPPFHLIKSDLPKNKLARANWIKRIKMFRALMIPELFVDQVRLEQLKGLELVLSKSSPFSYQYIHRRKQGTIDYLSFSGRVPSTRTNYENFFKEVKKHYNMEHSNARKQARLIDKKIREYIFLKNGVIQNGELHIIEEGFEIHALTTMDELECESLQMNNCVAGQYQKAFFKEMVHFHVSLAGNNFTLALKPETAAIIDFKKAKNLPPNKVESFLLKEFMKIHSEKIQHFLNQNLRSNLEFTTADSLKSPN